MSLTTGEIVKNRYRIQARLSQGGFGTVYRAWDINLERDCAIKENLDPSIDSTRNFKREAQILDKLSHPNLPHVIDHFIIPDQGQYLVMDFVEGQNLQEIFDDCGKPIPEIQVLSWLVQIIDAVDYLHSQNPPIIHRDIKPSNIKTDHQGKAMLVDFGTAKISGTLQGATVGERVLTPGYSPPEQYGGKTDERSDIYALGATMYHLLTGVQPQESILRKISEELKPPREINPTISIDIDHAITRALASHPNQRFQSVKELRIALPFREFGFPVAENSAAFAPEGEQLIRKQRGKYWNIISSKIPLSWMSWIGLLAIFLTTCIFTLFCGILIGNYFYTEKETLIISVIQTQQPIGLVVIPTVNTEEIEPIILPSLVIMPTHTPTPHQTLPLHLLLPSAVKASRPISPDAGTGSLWDKAVYRDLMQPGELAYSIVISNEQEWRWGFKWCAASSSQLNEILKPLSINFLIDNERVANQNFLQYENRDSNGWNCKNWVTLLSDFLPGSLVRLEINYQLSESIYDGRESYPPGDYSQVMFVTIK